MVVACLLACYHECYSLFPPFCFVCLFVCNYPGCRFVWCVNYSSPLNFRDTGGMFAINSLKIRKLYAATHSPYLILAHAQHCMCSPVEPTIDGKTMINNEQNNYFCLKFKQKKHTNERHGWLKKHKHTKLYVKQTI